MESLRYVGDKGLFCLRDSLLSIPAASEICYLRSHNSLHKHAATNLGVSVSKPITKRRPVLPFSSVSSAIIQAETQDDETETYDNINQVQTVHVRFQLQRECSFGQHFYIVGDDPLLGQWDPSAAVPFNWSDGHVWTTELDIPIGKFIKFKIILKDGSENIVWQPGPDRILQTLETQNRITVCEDWDNAELQMIIEEKFSLNQREEPIIIEEEITSSHKEVNVGKSNTVPGRGFVRNPKGSPADNLDENMNMLMVEGNGSIMNLKDSEVSTDETLSTNRLPLLVPGLYPLPKTQPEEKPLDEVEKNNLTNASSLEDDTLKHNTPELKYKEVLVNDYQELHQPLQIAEPEFFKDEDEHNPKSFDLVLVNDIQDEDPKSFDLVLANDVHWGVRTLQKLLAKFRFW